MNEIRLDALKKVIMFLVQKVAGLFLIALPFLMHQYGLSVDDPNEGLFYIISILFGVWLILLDELIVG